MTGTQEFIDFVDEVVNSTIKNWIIQYLAATSFAITYLIYVMFATSKIQVGYLFVGVWLIVWFAFAFAPIILNKKFTWYDGIDVAVFIAILGSLFFVVKDLYTLKTHTNYLKWKIKLKNLKEGTHVSWKVKQLSSKEEVWKYFTSYSFYEWLDFFKTLDETQKNKPELQNQLSEKNIAQFCYQYGLQKVYEDINYLTSKNFAKFSSWENKKFNINQNALEEYFVAKDETFIRDMFEINGRIQLATIGLKAELKELKYEKTKLNKIIVIF
ncbi:putative transmembrane protein [Spiroplasma clarkii]|nr:putative transmembrane protein [Spiroplasma clarkii]